MSLQPELTTGMVILCPAAPVVELDSPCTQICSFGACCVSGGHDALDAWRHAVRHGAERVGKDRREPMLRIGIYFELVVAAAWVSGRMRARR